MAAGGRREGLIRFERVVRSHRRRVCAWRFLETSYGLGVGTFTRLHLSGLAYRHRLLPRLPSFCQGPRPHQ